MEVLVGPTLGIEVSPTTPPQAKQHHHQVVAPTTPSPTSIPPPCLFVGGEEEDEDEEGGSVDSSIPSWVGSVKALEVSSDSSSSIGAPDDSDEEEEDDDENGTVVTSSSSKEALGSLDSLEEALPIKRGLSNHFSGKTKSFGNLSDASSVSSVKDLEKRENPFNKRRRILMANKLSRKSFYSWSNPKSMPLLTLNEEQYDDDDDDDDYGEQGDKDDPSPSSSSHGGGVVLEREKQRSMMSSKLYQRRFGVSFKSQSCVALADLQEEEQYYQ